MIDEVIEFFSLDLHEEFRVYLLRETSVPTINSSEDEVSKSIEDTQRAVDLHFVPPRDLHAMHLQGFDESRGSEDSSILSFVYFLNVG